MLHKKEMTEEDIKFRFITPAITAKWSEEQITMEMQITDGKINLRGNLATRGTPKKADYILYAAPNYPIAVVEAKNNRHSVSHGMQQAKTYAKMLDVPFAYSSNGDAFSEYDQFTGLERELPLEDFPSPEELIARYHEGRQNTDREKQLMGQPYYSSQNTHEPRYYQRNAINRTVEATARGQQRILLTLATGTGKTYIAFQIVYRLLKSGLKKKILYLADRNVLVDQSIQQDFSPLKSSIHKINYAKDDPTTITSHEVYFSLYQQLTDREDEITEDEEAPTRLEQLFRRDFFDLIIVDECHRGSAKKDSNWRKILEYFESATQIGMTATPKETRYVSNINYFGEALYHYSLRNGIEDGFLAPFKVVNVRTNIGEGWRPVRGQVDKYGNEIEDRIYANSDYDYNIILESRVEEVAREITEYLHQFGRMNKTIVFCATEDHAERMRIALANLNADMMQEYDDYVVRITGSDDYGKSKLDYFISVASPTPVIATTSKLLSTGVDCKMTKLIVLDQMINSMSEFKQIIGRGTRLRWEDKKTHFVIMDFRNITRLFSDPDWDGEPIEIIELEPEPGAGGEPPLIIADPPGPYEPSQRIKPVVDVYGCPVQITGKSVAIYDESGKLLRQESIIDYTKSNILGNYASLDAFIRQWSEAEKKESILQLLQKYGIDLDSIKEERAMSNVDDFDFICHVAYDQKPLTRQERANQVKKRDFLNKYKDVARQVLEALLDTYMNMGIYEIEKTEILKLDPFKQFGSPSKIAQFFGGKEAYLKAVKELEEELYKAS